MGVTLTHIPKFIILRTALIPFIQATSRQQKSVDAKTCHFCTRGMGDCSCLEVHYRAWRLHSESSTVYIQYTVLVCPFSESSMCCILRLYCFWLLITECPNLFMSELQFIHTIIQTSQHILINTTKCCANNFLYKKQATLKKRAHMNS